MPLRVDAKTLVQRVLLLERRQGFQDRAAVGGLTAFVRLQLEKAEPVIDPVLTGVASALEQYAAADLPGREAAVSSALQCLQGGLSNSDASTVTDVGRSTSHAVAPKAHAGTPSTPAPPASPIVHGADELDYPVSRLKGVRKPTIEALGKLGVRTIGELLYYFPRTHYDFTDTRSISRLRVGQKTTLVGTIENVRSNRTARGAVITTAAVADETGTVAVRWFNQPYLSKYLPVGARVAISGQPDVFHGFITFQPKDYELIDQDVLTHVGRLVPIYPLAKGLYQKSLRSLMRRVVEAYSGAVEEYLPPGMAGNLRLPDIATAVRQYHFPEDEDRKSWAEQRLAFDELLLVQLGLLLRKREWQQDIPAVVIALDRELETRFRDSLPFALTSAQEEAGEEILADMARPRPMSRLLQGDVGSGKTVVAATALLQTVNRGKQAVLMAPTEILAGQHFRTLQTLLNGFDVRSELLIGSTPRAQRRAILTAAADGGIDILIGTHALIQEGVEFSELGLAITDEQHRFGVEQRAALRQKGHHPHILALTATPIPRTLAMTIYGDLDVSVIDEMPPGRISAITTWCQRPTEAHSVVRDEIGKGHQAFVICPVIEESADSDMRSVLAEHRELSSLVFPDLNVGLLHGKMKPKDKDRTLDAFRRGEYHIMVATSVVEVGIDIPNATVMVIRDAHRFGLAQLHQFRGRVGRGGDQAYCVLLSDTEGDDARERLEALTASDNGFELAEQDLRLRGPGEFWGTRQSGLPELRVATLGDLPTIQLARQAAQEVLAGDPDLASEDNRLLRERVRRFWSEAADLS